MIIKFYWITRVLGYVASMIGIFLFLLHKTDADQSLAQTGLGLVGLGFFGFFISYGLRAWLRFGPGAKSREE